MVKYQQYFITNKMNWKWCTTLRYHFVDLFRCQSLSYTINAIKVPLPITVGTPDVAWLICYFHHLLLKGHEFLSSSKNLFKTAASIILRYMFRSVSATPFFCFLPNSCLIFLLITPMPKKLKSACASVTKCLPWWL